MNAAAVTQKNRFKPRVVLVGGRWCRPMHFERAFRKPISERGYEIIDIPLPFHQQIHPHAKLGQYRFKDYLWHIIPEINHFAREDHEGCIFIGFDMGGFLGALMASSALLLSPFRA